MQNVRIHPAGAFIPSGVNSHVRVPVTTTPAALDALITIPTITVGASAVRPSAVYLSKELGATGDVLVTWSGQTPMAKLPTPGSITVTPTLTQTASITVVAGSALVDGDYFTLNDGTNSYVFEFDSGGGVTPGNIAIAFTGGELVANIRGLCIAAINGTAILATASIGGADAVTLTMDTPGVAGGVNSENVTDGGFAVTSFADPTAATTVTYKLVARDALGYVTDAGAASSTAAATSVLSASNYNHLSWAAVANAASYDIYRTVSPTTPATTGKINAAPITGTTFDDTGLAGDSATAPSANIATNFGYALPTQPSPPLMIVVQPPGIQDGTIKLVASSGTVYVQAKFEWLDGVTG